MTNQTPSPPSSSENHAEHHDEAIAAVLALVVLGTVFFVAVNRDKTADTKTPASLAELAGGNPEVEEHQDETDDELSSDGRFPFAGLDLASDGSDEEDGRVSSEEDAHGRDRSVVSPLLTLAPIGVGDSDGRGPAQLNTTTDGDGIATSDDLDTSSSPSTNLEPTSSPSALSSEEVNSEETASEDASSAETASAETASAETSSEDASSAGTSSAETVDAPPAQTVDADATTGSNNPSGESSDPLVEVEAPELAVEVPTQAFPDVAPQYWANPFIEGLRQQDIVTGFVGGEFDPDSVISRAQFASQLDRAFPPTERSPLRNYDDVPTDHPQHSAITQVTKSGFMQGNDVGAFLPDKQVSRMEVLLALVSGLDLTPSADPTAILNATYQDADTIPIWAVDKMATATELGMVVFQENPATFDPLKPATRAEAAAMLYQALAHAGEVPIVESEYIIRPQ